MAKAIEVAAPVQELALESSKLKKLIIKNFRCIGKTPVEIELDDIVVLVGPNNAGKSTILRAYEVVMNQPSSEGNLALEDFPDEKVDPQALPEIELQTYVREDRAADVWLHLDPETGKRFVRERWTWDGPGPSKRQGFKVDGSDWDDHAPWGWNTVAKARRPQPRRIDAFARPEEQANKIVELLRDALLDRAERAADEEGTPSSALARLRDTIKSVQKEVLEETQTTIAKIEAQLSGLVAEVFAGFSVSFKAKEEEVAKNALSLFKTEPLLRMGPTSGYMAPVDKQGSGARRTLLWAALKLLGEQPPAP